MWCQSCVWEQEFGDYITSKGLIAKIRVEEMVLWAKYFASISKYPNLISATHRKCWIWNHVLAISAVGERSDVGSQRSLDYLASFRSLWNTLFQNRSGLFLSNILWDWCLAFKYSHVHIYTHSRMNRYIC